MILGRPLAIDWRMLIAAAAGWGLADQGNAVVQLCRFVRSHTASLLFCRNMNDYIPQGPVTVWRQELEAAEAWEPGKQLLELSLAHSGRQILDQYVGHDHHKTPMAVECEHN